MHLEREGIFLEDTAWLVCISTFLVSNTAERFKIFENVFPVFTSARSY